MWSIGILYGPHGPGGRHGGIGIGVLRQAPSVGMLSGRRGDAESQPVIPSPRRTATGDRSRAYALVAGLKGG